MQLIKNKLNLNNFIKDKYKIYLKLNHCIKMNIYILEIEFLILKNYKRSLSK